MIEIGPGRIKVDPVAPPYAKKIRFDFLRSSVFTLITMFSSNGNLPSLPTSIPSGPSEFEVHATGDANKFGTHHGTRCTETIATGMTMINQLAAAPSAAPNSASVTVQPQFHLHQSHGDGDLLVRHSNSNPNQLSLTPSELDEILWSSFTDQTVYSTPWPDDPGPGPVTPLSYSSDSHQVCQTHATTNSTTDATAISYAAAAAAAAVAAPRTTRFHDPHISSTNNNNLHTHRPSPEPSFLLQAYPSTTSTTDTIPPAAAFELNPTRINQLPSHHPSTTRAAVDLSNTTNIPGPAKVLDARGVNDLPSLGLLPKTSLPRPTMRASTACISCRKLKVACDNQRPCSRCAKKGKECLRTDQEIKSTPEKVKKRPISSVAAPTTKTIVVAAVTTLSPAPSPPLNLLTKIPLPTPSCTQSPDSTFELWSHSYLTLLTQMDVRDTILKLNAKFDTLPVDLPTILHWHTQISFMCCHVSEQMSDQDFRTFLTQGLSSEILNSRLWTSSPFAPWATFSTRPFFTIHTTLAPGEETLPNNHPSKIQSDIAELYFEFAPSSNKGFTRFLEMQTARIMFERQLSNGRIRKLNSSTNHQQQMAAASNSSSHPSTNSTHISSNSSSTASTNDMVDLHVNGVDDSDSRLMAPLFESLAKFTLFDFTASLSAPPPAHIVEDENKYAEFHARWCPMSFAPSSAANANHSSGNKLKRTSWIDSVHGSTKPISNTNLDHVPLADLLSSDHTSFRCICSSSTPLPATIRINPGFERLFGWRRIEVEQQFQLEGSSWLRHLSPISSYAAQHRYWINHFKSHIIAMGEMAIQVAAAYSNQLESQQLSTPSSTFGGVIAQPLLPPPVPVSELDPWFSQTCHIRRKSGEIDPHLYHQRCTIQPSDGQTKPTTTTIRWNKLETANT